jgi:hypothetical protein
MTTKKPEVESRASNFGAKLGEFIFFAFLRQIQIFAYGYASGWVLAWFCGDTVAWALNMIVGEPRFTAEAIPAVTATLLLVGSLVFKPRKYDVQVEQVAK